MKYNKVIMSEQDIETLKRIKRNIKDSTDSRNACHFIDQCYDCPVHKHGDFMDISCWEIVDILLNQINREKKLKRICGNFQK